MDDLISRLSELRSQYNCFDEAEEPYYRALSEVIKMLSEQADGDTISRQAAIDALKEHRALFCDNIPFSKLSYAEKSRVDELDMAIATLINLPSAQPERTGRWIKISPAGIYECNLCGKNVMTDDIEAYAFCHGCGARMEGEADG